MNSVRKTVDYRNGGRFESLTKLTKFPKSNLNRKYLWFCAKCLLTGQVILNSQTSHNQKGGMKLHKRCPNCFPSLVIDITRHQYELGNEMSFLFFLLPNSNQVLVHLILLYFGLLWRKFWFFSPLLFCVLLAQAFHLNKSILWSENNQTVFFCRHHFNHMH